MHLISFNVSKGWTGTSGVTGALFLWEPVLLPEQGPWLLQGQTVCPPFSRGSICRTYSRLWSFRMQQLLHTVLATSVTVHRKGSSLSPEAARLGFSSEAAANDCQHTALRASWEARQGQHATPVAGSGGGPVRYCCPAGA